MIETNSVSPENIRISIPLRIRKYYGELEDACREVLECDFEIEMIRPDLVFLYTVRDVMV